VGNVPPTLRKSGAHIQLGVEQGQLSRVGQSAGIPKPVACASHLTLRKWAHESRKAGLLRAPTDDEPSVGIVVAGHAVR
jgi:hypothetical protein